MKLINKIIVFIGSRIPVLRALDGKKRFVGNVLLVLAAVLYEFQRAMGASFPEVNLEYLSALIAIVGAGSRLLGDIHAQAKSELAE